MYRMFIRTLVWNTKLVGSQKKKFDKNSDIPMHFILLNIDKDVPDSSKNVYNYWIIVHWKSAERFNIPVSSLLMYDTFVDNENVQRTLIMIGDKYLNISFDSGKDYMIDCSGRDISPGYTRVYCSTTKALVSAKTYRDWMHTIIANMDISLIFLAWRSIMHAGTAVCVVILRI